MMIPCYRSLKTIVVAMLAVCISAATVWADQKPADPPKTPPIKQKKLLEVSKKPVIGHKLMAQPKQPPIAHKPMEWAKKPMAVHPMEGGVDARLMRLEKKLDAVMRELHELRRELHRRPPRPSMSAHGPGPMMGPPFGPPQHMRGWPPRKPHHGPAAHRHRDSRFPGTAHGPQPPRGPRTQRPHGGHHAGPPAKLERPVGAAGIESGPPKLKPGSAPDAPPKDVQGSTPPAHPKSGPPSRSPGKPKPPGFPKGEPEAGRPEAADAF